MTEVELIDKIRAQSKIAKNLLEGDGGYNIKRGMAHVISGYVEDVFALYIAKKINKLDYQYLVDKVTSIKFSPKGKATVFKPDVSIINSENVLTHYFDLKTNLGWNRDLQLYLKKKNDFVNKIKGRAGWIHFSKDDIQSITFSKKLKYKMVVIYGGNINKTQLNENIRLAKEFENVELFILYKFEDDKTHSIDYEDFERLHLEINNLCN